MLQIALLILLTFYGICQFHLPNIFLKTEEIILTFDKELWVRWNVMLSDRFISSFLGKNCDINIDDCSPNPCQHGSSCIDLVNGYNCSCSDEWMGKNCTDVYDACWFAPCKNGATCSTTKPRKDYSCACVSGFSGHDCGTNIDDCKPDSCVDPFVCHDLVNNYTCACPTGLWMFTHI